MKNLTKALKKQFRKRFPYQVDDGEKALCVAIAALRMAEVNAQMIVKSNGLMDYQYMSMMYQNEALSMMTAAEALEEGSDDRVSLEIVAEQLNESAKRLEALSTETAMGKDNGKKINNKK